MGQIGCGHLECSVYRDQTRGFGELLTERWADAKERTKKLRVRDLEDPFHEDDDALICFKDKISLIETTLAFGKTADIHNLYGALRQLTRELKHKDKDVAAELRKLVGNFSLVKVAKDMGLKRLEYCRALHAEENALPQVARIGGIAVQRGTIYTTASPCELCTKKIYQTGIRSIIYTEVYPGYVSKAFREDGVRAIRFVQFEGVKSPGYHRLFKPDYPLKETQRIREDIAKGRKH
jgi:deoxycytidylate deaminase